MGYLQQHWPGNEPLPFRLEPESSHSCPLEPGPPSGDAVESFIRREDEARFVEEMRGGDRARELARLEERELEAGMSN